MIGIIALLIIIFLFKNKESILIQENKMFPSLPNFSYGKICSRYENEIIAAANIFRVPAKIIDAIIFVESYDGANTNHQSSAKGLMGVKPVAAQDVLATYGKQLASDMNLYNLDEPQTNIVLGTGYLRLCFNVWKNWEQSIIAYHDGIRNPNVKNTENISYLNLVINRMNVQC